MRQPVGVLHGPRPIQPSAVALGIRNGRLAAEVGELVAGREACQA